MALIPPYYVDTVVAVGTRISGQITWIGTGFLFGDLTEVTPDGSNEYSVYLVTNKHVVKDFDSIVIRFNPKDNTPAKDYDIALKNQNQLLWTGHSDPEIDVAIIPINAGVVHDEGMKYGFFHSDKHVATIPTMTARGTSEGDFIFVLGFPMGLIAKDRQHVFVRTGVISRIKDLFENRAKDFVIDSVVFPGNSGGPVVTKPEISSIVGTQATNRSDLIGLVKSYIPYNDVAVSQQTKRPRIIFEENTGLTKVEPVDHIIQTIEELKKKNAPQQNV